MNNQIHIRKHHAGNPLLKTGLALALAMCAAGAMACTGMYAGRKVSADGTVLIGRTVDTSPWTSCHMIRVTPRVENQPGRVYAGMRSGVTWNLPPTTWKFISTPRISSLYRGVMDSACINEKGLAVSGTVTASTNAKTLAADPFVKAGFGEDSLPGLLIQCCATAREAIDLLGRVIAAKGHDNAETYMLADKDEAWYVEVYTGHQWVAVRMPEDKVAVYGNQFMLRSLDLSSADVLHSPGIVSVPEKAGTLVRDAAGNIDLFRSYASPLRDYSNYRTWFGHATFAPGTAGKYAENRPMPMFFAPEKKVSIPDMFELMRSRYEGKGRCPDETGDQNVRVIGTTKQATCHVLSLDSRLPEKTRATMWVCLANAEHSVFMPVNAAVERSAWGYEFDHKDGMFRPDTTLPGVAFRRLCALAEEKRYWYGSKVREYWRAEERRFLREYPAIVAGGDGGRITRYTVAAEEKALADARRMFDELMAYAIQNNRIKGDGSGADFQPAAPYRPKTAGHRTKVLFFFDTEDFTCDESSNAIRDIANILHEEGVRGQFAMVGQLGPFLTEMKRKDVIDALKHHLIGSQTLYHSKHPNIVEYGDIEDYDAAYKRTWEEEKLGFDLLEKALGQRSTWCSVFPGPANSYVGLYVHSKLGSPFFGGGNMSFTPAERDAAWFVNQFHLPYYKKLHLESFIPPNRMVDIPRRLDELATREVVTLYMHPHMALSKRHWDGPNFNPRDPVEWGKWRPTPKRDKMDVAIYYDRFRTLVRALVKDGRFEVTDCERLYKSFARRVPIGKAEVGQIRRSLDRRLGPIASRWCVSDAFQAAVKLLRGEKSHMPGYVYGFLHPPKGVEKATKVKASDLKAVAAKIDLGTFIPPEIEVGGVKIGPADFLYAALEVIDTGADEVTVKPRDQLGPIHQLMPTLATYSMKGGWGLFMDSFEDKYLTARLRLQLWTLWYEPSIEARFTQTAWQGDTE